MPSGAGESISFVGQMDSGSRRAIYMMPINGQHIASMLVALAVGLLAVRYLIKFVRGKKDEDEFVDGGFRAAFFSGVLFVNALAHFTHGISGEDFPAPFSYLLATPLLRHLSNVLWGFLNIWLGYGLLVSGRVFCEERSRTITFFAGILAMGLFLAIVFSHL